MMNQTQIEERYKSHTSLIKKYSEKLRTEESDIGRQALRELIHDFTERSQELLVVLNE